MPVLNRDFFLDQDNDSFDSDTFFGNGQLNNGAGCVPSLVIRVTRSDPLPTISIGPIQSADGQIVFDAVGDISWRVTSTASQRFALRSPNGRGVGEIVLTSADGTRTSFRVGTVFVSPGVALIIP